MYIEFIFHWKLAFHISQRTSHDTTKIRESASYLDNIIDPRGYFNFLGVMHTTIQRIRFISSRDFRFLFAFIVFFLSNRRKSIVAFTHLFSVGLLFFVSYMLPSILDPQPQVQYLIASLYILYGLTRRTDFTEIIWIWFDQEIIINFDFFPSVIKCPIKWKKWCDAWNNVNHISLMFWNSSFFLFFLI